MGKGPSRAKVVVVTIVGAAMALLATGGAALAGRRCPGRPEVAKLLKLEGTGWQTTCRADEGGQLLLAALAPPTGKDAAPELVVAEIAGAETSRRVAWKISSGDDKRVHDAITQAEDWTVRVSRTKLGGQKLIMVSLVTKWGGNLLATYEIVVFFRESGLSLIPLWSGIGDWEENRFDICLLKARASFKLETSVKDEGRGKLERTTRIDRRKGKGPVDEEPAKQVQRECVVVPVQRDVFEVAVPPL
jgi:hypothetical protein